MTYLTYHSMSLSISLNYIRSFRIILFSARSRCYGVYFHAAACFHFGNSPCLTDFWKAPEQHLRQGWDYTFHILACHVFVVPSGMCSTYRPDPQQHGQAMSGRELPHDVGGNGTIRRSRLASGRAVHWVHRVHWVHCFGFTCEVVRVCDLQIPYF